MVELAPEVRLALTSKSPSIVREALIKHDYLILPVLCHFPWLIPFLTCDKVVVVDSDSDGRFDAEIWYRCAGDKPDLYFWVDIFWMAPGSACADLRLPGRPARVAGGDCSYRQPGKLQGDHPSGRRVGLRERHGDDPQPRHRHQSISSFDAQAVLRAAWSCTWT